MAKRFSLSNFAIVGHGKFGGFTLKRRVLHAPAATHTKDLDNAEIHNVIKIMGLWFKKCERVLRYGNPTMKTDHDQDGSHITGLLFNFIRTNLPLLPKLLFLEEFISPNVETTKSKTELSYFVHEFAYWKTDFDDSRRLKVKYYKPLGTSRMVTEVKGYFMEMLRYQTMFKLLGTEDHQSTEQAFWNTNDQCKERLRNGMELRKQLHAIPRVHFHEHGQRKVLHGCLHNNTSEIKGPHLGSSVNEHLAYRRHGVSLMSTFVA
ncbi:hypothetical protein HPB48_015223 [Haemaphysalis longicornis]|uniref:DNA topoisomerase (ATP-hydrolyzing) n=1 Tax=Haemaphysalis longicornis TaxID=44386 RepID=A0A9J6F9A9_HAELO|nr:hypothetical protein HPB48_015223 [Haemaphysalis longicornis]